MNYTRKSPMDREQKVIFTRRISQSNKTQLICVLFDIFFAYLDEGENAVKAGDMVTARDELRHANQVIMHLKSDLNFKYDLSKQLYPLYDFCQRAIERSNFTKNTEGIEEARRIMKPLQDAFSEVAKSDHSASMMRNTEQVVAGMTYGRGNLNETTEQYDKSRGFFA